jgi:hypothetical protein
MKKVMLIAFAVVLVISFTAHATSVRDELVQLLVCATADGGIHAAANGFTLYHFGMSNESDGMVIHVQNAAPHYTYAIYATPTEWSRGELLGTITTDEEGGGSINLRENAVIYIGIYNESDDWLLRGRCFIPPCGGV